VRPEIHGGITTKKSANRAPRSVRPSGRVRSATKRESSIPDSQERRPHLASIVSAIPARNEAESQMQRNDALLAQSDQLASLGFWIADAGTYETYWSDQFYRILGLDPQHGPVRLETLFGLIHPEDREQVRARFLAAMEVNDLYKSETRYLLPGDRLRVFHTRCLPITDSSGRVVRVVGMSQDITDHKEIEEKMRKNEALLEQAEQLANLGSWEYDVERQTFAWSDQMYRMLARKPGEGTISLDQACAIFHPDDRARVWQDVQRIIADGVSMENELRFILPDGQIRIFHSRAVPVKDASGSVRSIRGMSQDITGRKRTEEELRQLSQQLLNIRDDERRRMARDLHESAAQSLAALKMTLSRVAEVLHPENEQGHQLLASSLELTEDAIREVRTLSHLMHPPMLDFVGLGPALRWFAAGFSERSHIIVKVEIDEDFGRLPQETEIAIFRIVQEALTNVHRHSGSRSASIRVTRQTTGTYVQVQDQGQGIAFPSESAGGRAPVGIGIAGIRERVKQLNGEFNIQSAPGKGTTLSVLLPFPKDKTPI
jgi:PAS domain S-box-containing protein